MPAHLDRTLDEGRHRGRWKGWKGRRDSFRKRMRSALARSMQMGLI
jgi:hypothetical protein